MNSTIKNWLPNLSNKRKFPTYKETNRVDGLNKSLNKKI